MQLEPGQTIHVRFKMGLMWKAFVIFGILSGIVLYAMVAEYPGADPRADLMTWFGFSLGCLSLLLFLPLSLVSLYTIVTDRPYLTIAPDGLHFSLLAGKVHLPWEEIADVRPDYEVQHPLIRISVRNPDAFVERQGLLYRWLHGSGSQGGQLRLSTDGHEFDFAEVLLILEMGVDAARGKQA